MKLVAAMVFMCFSGTCMKYDVEVENKACSYGSFKGRYMGMDATLGIKCHK